jgi:hypothetical protein
MRRWTFFLFCLSVAVVPIGCNRKPNDEAIEKDIQARVAEDPQTQDAELAVQSKQGSVKLTGKVKTPTAQQKVVKIAKNEPGVSAVDDETSIESVAPVQPARPVPNYSAAQKIGMFAYPKNNQSRDQQLIDELDCYNGAQQQSGISPDQLSVPTAPTSAEVQAAQQEAAASAGQGKGGRVRGAAKGAAGGVMIGAIAGDAGKGAAIGAVGGTMVGGTRQRRANAQAKQEAANTASAQMQGDYNQAKAAYNQQMDTFRRAFSACMDARNYSVK